MNIIKNSIKEDIMHELCANITFFGRMHGICVNTGYNESITLNSKEILLKRERSVVNVT